MEFADGAGGEGQHVLELPGGKRGVFAGALHFDKGVVGEHGDVHVDVRVDVFGIIEIDDGHALDDADADGGDLVGQRLGGGGEEAGLAGGGDGVGDGDPGAGDGGGAGAAVGLEHVAIDEEGEPARRPGRCKL